MIMTSRQQIGGIPIEGFSFNRCRGVFCFFCFFFYFFIFGASSDFQGKKSLLTFTTTMATAFTIQPGYNYIFTTLRLYKFI